MIRTSLLASLALAACGGASPKQVVSNHGEPHGLDRSIRTVDFLDHTYQSQMGDEAPESITVRNGDYERPKDADGNEAGFFHAGAPVYGDVDGDGVEDAIVITIDNGGGTGMFDVAHVFTMKGGQVAEIAVVPGGDRGDGGLRDVTPEPGGVKVERLTSVEGDGACCPSKLTVEHWRWTGKDLAIDDKQTTTIDNPDAQK